MPDITMCKGGSCPKKESCYRYTASPSMRQSYFMIPPVNEQGECAAFSPLVPIEKPSPKT